MTATLWHGDCLQEMERIPDGSVDAVIADLPYQVTACAWDIMIPFAPLWEHYKRVIKRNGAIVLFGSQPFTSALVMSNLAWFKFSLVWDKVNKYTNFLNAKKRPMRRHEDILVFSAGQHTYNPQMQAVTPYKSRRSQPSKTANYGKVNGCDYGDLITQHNPCSVIAIPSHFTTNIQHPTQKPVALGEYLIRTYTNEGDTVLDNCFGSGSFAVAAMNTNRSFIGIEKYPLLDRPVDAKTNPNYFYEARERIQAALSQARQLALAI